MAQYEKREVDPKVREVSRRRFLRNAGITAAAVPFLGTFGEVLLRAWRGRETTPGVTDRYQESLAPATRPTGLPWCAT